MSTSAVNPKCAYCGQMPHPGVCPTVKAIEYYADGTVKRVEFKTAADYSQSYSTAPGQWARPPFPPTTWFSMENSHEIVR